MAGASGISRPILPRMKDNIRSNYYNVSQEFESAAMNPHSNLANSVLAMGLSLFKLCSSSNTTRAASSSFTLSTASTAATGGIIEIVDTNSNINNDYRWDSTRPGYYGKSGEPNN